MALNALVDSVLPQSEKCGTERVKTAQPLLKALDYHNISSLSLWLFAASGQILCAVVSVNH